MKSSYLITQRKDRHGNTRKTFTPYLRFTHEGKKYTLSTGLSIPAALWLKQGVSTSATKMRDAGWTAPDITDANSRLDQLQAELHKLYGLEKLELEFDIENVKAQWEAFRDGKTLNRTRRPKARGTTLVDMLHQFIKHKTTVPQATTAKRGTVKKATVDNYMQVVHHVAEFDAFTKRETTLNQVDLSWYYSFTEYLTQRMELAASTAGKVIRNLKTALSWADLAGMKVNSDYRQKEFCEPYVDPEFEPLDAVLSWDEIEQVRNMKLTGTAEVARDLFVISCFTGMRASDLERLDRVTIVQGKKGRALQWTPMKAKSRPLTVPMFKEVRDIHERWEGWPERLSGQAINKHLKAICKAAGFNDKMQGKVDVTVDVMGTRKRRKVIRTGPRYQFVTCHSGRRSFCTNWYDDIPKHDDLDLSQIMRWSGHTKEQVFFLYINRQPITDGDAGFKYRD